MAEPQYPYLYQTPYMPGMMSMGSNPEMGMLMSMFAGQVLGPMFGPENFLPHLSAGMGVMDQFAAKHYQEQQLISTNEIATANNENVAQRLLAARTAITGEAASETNLNQSRNIAGIINHPILKALIGQAIGPETLEAMLHGTKGDISQLHNATAQMGAFMHDPSGARKMDAGSLADYTSGVYAHLYEEGGDLGRLTDELTLMDSNTRQASNQAVKLKQAAKIADNTQLVSDAEFMQRVQIDDPVQRDRISQVYQKYVQGNETDTAKQAEAIAKIQPAVQETGMLGDNEMMISHAKRAAEKQQVNEMHGLMAGEVSQLQRHLFQQGQLPRMLGSMSAAERVKLMGGEIDEDTLTRIAETQIKRDLASDEDYVRGNDAEKREMVAGRLDSKKQELRDTQAAIRQYNEDVDAGRTPTASISELEELGGFEAIASNVDSKRTASVLKKYSGAIDAVREIFGDNGNPNAPMGALIAAMNHLTQGATAQLDAKGVEAKLRQMQSTAKEAGIGFEQMAAMSAQMGAMGQTLGLDPVTQMHGTVNAMALVKTMRDTGAFSSPRAGAMDMGQAQQAAMRQIAGGDASDNARAMAAAAQIYDVSKEEYAGTEFAAAMEAYRSGTGTYTYNGETKNLFEMVGERGSGAVTELFTAAGGNDAELTAAFRSPTAVAEAIKSGAGFKTQKYEAIRDITNFGVGGMVEAQLRDFKEAGGGDELKNRSESGVASIAGRAMSELLVDSAHLDTKTQTDLVIRELPKKLEESFIAQGVPEAEAKKLAQETAEAMLGPGAAAGDDAKTQKQKEAQQRGRVNHYRNRTDATIHNLSGGQFNIVSFGNMFGQNRPEDAMAYSEDQAHRAARRAKAGEGYKSNPFARASDYLLEAGETGRKVNFGDLMSAVMNVVPEQELARKYVSGMLSGFEATQKRIDEITYSESDIKTVIDKAASGDQAAATELQRLSKASGVKLPSAIFDNAAYVTAGDKEAQNFLSTASDADIQAAYLQATGSQSTGLSRAEQVKALQAVDKDGAPTAARRKFLEQQRERAFIRDHAFKDEDGNYIEDLSDENILTTYQLSGLGTGIDADGNQLSADTMRQAVMQTARFTSRGNELLDEKGITTSSRLAKEMAAKDGVYDLLRPDSGATEKELKFLRSFNISAFGAAEDDTRKKILESFVDTYGLADADSSDDLNTVQTLEQYVANTDPESAEAKEKLASVVRAQIEASAFSGTAEEKEQLIQRAQQIAETARVGSAIDPKGQGITQIGDISTQTARISAGQNVIIEGATIVTDSSGNKIAQSGGQPPQKSGADGAQTAPAAQKEESQSFLGYLGAGITAAKRYVLGGAEKPEQQAADIAAEYPEGRQDQPLPAQRAQLSPAGRQKTVYDLTPQDLVQQIGTSTEAQLTELDQAAGLLGSVKKLKDADTMSVTQRNAEEKIFGVKMKDAIATGLLPRPVDDDGDLVSDLSSPAAIAAAEKHLQKYLPADAHAPAKTKVQQQPDAAPASEAQVSKVKPLSVGPEPGDLAVKHEVIKPLSKEEQRARVKELAAASGIDYNLERGVKTLTRGSVPIEVNGQSVDFNAMTDRELALVGGAAQISMAMTKDKTALKEDTALLEKVKKIQATREAAAAEQISQELPANEDKPLTPKAAKAKAEAAAARASGVTQKDIDDTARAAVAAAPDGILPGEDKPLTVKTRSLAAAQAGLQQHREQIAAAKKAGDSNKLASGLAALAPDPEVAATIAYYTQSGSKTTDTQKHAQAADLAVQAPAAAALPGNAVQTVSGADAQAQATKTQPTQVTADSVAAATAVSQKTTQLVASRGGSGSQGAQQPMQISGVLSVKNLKEAVFEAQNEAGGPIQMAGDLEYYGGMG